MGSTRTEADFWSEAEDPLEAVIGEPPLSARRVRIVCGLALCLLAMGWAAFGLFPLEYWTRVASLHMHPAFAAGLALSAPVLLALHAGPVHRWVGRRSFIERLAALPVLMLVEYLAVDRLGLLGRAAFGGVVTGLLAWLVFLLLRALPART